MPKCKRKKQRVFDFFHLTKERMDSNVDWPDWMHSAWNKDRGALGSLWRYKTVDGEDIFITYIHDDYWPYSIIVEDDYIVKQRNGELINYRPEVFNEIFEMVE